MDRDRFGKFLMKLRREHEFTQIELAEIIGVSHQAVSKWENGASVPDIDFLRKLSELYGYSLDDLINGKERSIEIAQRNKEENKRFRLRLLLGIELTILGYICAYASAMNVLETVSAVWFGAFLVLGTVGLVMNTMYYSAMQDKDNQSLKRYALAMTFSIGMLYYIIELFAGREHYNLNAILFDTPYFVAIGFVLYFIILAVIYRLNNKHIQITKDHIIHGLGAIILIVITLITYRWYDELFRYTIDEKWLRIGNYVGMWPEPYFWEIGDFLLLMQASLSMVIIVILFHKSWRDFYLLIPTGLIMLLVSSYSIIDYSTKENLWYAELFRNNSMLLFWINVGFFLVQLYLLFRLIIRFARSEKVSITTTYTTISSLLMFLGYWLFTPEVTKLTPDIQQHFNVTYTYRLYMTITPFNYSLFFAVILGGLLLFVTEQVKKTINSK